jgi:hypothetical protein
LDHMLSPTQTILSYTDLSDFVHARPPLQSPTDNLSLLLDKIIHPYNVEAIETLLSKHNLSPNYPYLVQNLRLGFPRGPFTTPRIDDYIAQPPVCIERTCYDFGIPNDRARAREDVRPVFKSGHGEVLSGSFLCFATHRRLS